VSVSEWVDWIQALPGWVGAVVLFLGAMVEYVFPPFPGDTVVVAGSALVTLFGWRLWPVMFLVTAGSVAGSMVSWLVGRALARSGRRGVARGGKGRIAVDMLAERFERHGAAYLALNRFMPGVRTFFFVGAGWVGIDWRETVLWSTLSAAVWNALLVALGYWVGDNLPLLEQLLARYAAGVGIVIVGVIGWQAWRIGRALRKEDPGAA